MYRTIDIGYPDWHIGRHGPQIWDEIFQVYQGFEKTRDQFLAMVEVVTKPVKPLFLSEESVHLMDWLAIRGDLDKQVAKTKLTSFLLLDSTINVVTAEPAYPNAYPITKLLEVNAIKIDGEKADLDTNFHLSRVFPTYDALDLLRDVEERRLKLIFGEAPMEKKDFNGYDHNTHYGEAFSTLAKEIGVRDFLKDFLAKRSAYYIPE